MGCKEQDNYMESIFNSSPVPMISLDTRLRIIMFNHSAEELTGFRSTEVSGRRITTILPFRRVRNIIKMLRIRKQVSFDGFITRLKNIDCSEVPVRLKISPLIDSENDLIGVLLLASDLREIKELQSKLLEAERLAAITETAISVNHEINNPLCSILGNTQLMLMQQEKLDPGMIRMLRNIEKQTARIQEIAEKLGKITKPVFKEYVGGKKMLDVERSEIKNSV